MKNLLVALWSLIFTTATLGAESVVFNARSAHSGPWSDAQTWEGGRRPRAGDFVQVRAAHIVIYDVHSEAALRMLHIAGTLTFSREHSTLLDVGLIKIEPGETTTEDGFDCHDEHGASPPLSVGTEQPALEIGTLASPIPSGIKATIRLRHFPGTNTESLPAILSCEGRWSVHGAPMNRTWLKLAAPAAIGDVAVTVEQPVSDWHVGDRVIITNSQMQRPETGATQWRS